MSSQQGSKDALPLFVDGIADWEAKEPGVKKRMVFRAKGTTAKVIVSDLPGANEPGDIFGQEQTFNFLEIQPYWE